MWLRVLLLNIAAASVMAVVPAKADERRHDSLVSTSACDEPKASATARTLFEYAERYFERYKTTKPLEEQVSVDDFCGDGSAIKAHDASFDNFGATFLIDTDDSRRLLALSTRSGNFVLPDGLKLG